MKVKGWKKVFPANGNEKKDWIVIFISDKTDFKTKTVNKKQRRILHNDQGINPRRRYNMHPT